MKDENIVTECIRPFVLSHQYIVHGTPSCTCEHTLNILKPR